MFHIYNDMNFNYMEIVFIMMQSFLIRGDGKSQWVNDSHSICLHTNEENIKYMSLFFFVEKCFFFVNKCFFFILN